MTIQLQSRKTIVQHVTVSHPEKQSNSRSHNGLRCAIISHLTQNQSLANATPSAWMPNALNPHDLSNGNDNGRFTRFVNVDIVGIAFINGVLI